MRGRAILRATVTTIFLGLLSLALACVAYPDFQARKLLAARGLETSGTVGNPVTGKAPGRRSGEEVRGFWYDYAVDGRTFSRRSTLASRYSLPPRGSRIPVTYSPDDHGVAVPYAKRAIPMTYFGGDGEKVAYFWFGLIVAAVAAVASLPRIIRERRLARHGEPAVATVAGQSGSAPRSRTVFGMAVENPRGRGFGGFRTEYGFQTGEGRDVRGVFRNDPDKREPGSRLQVLFDPARPERNIPLLSLEYWQY